MSAVTKNPLKRRRISRMLQNELPCYLNLKYGKQPHYSPETLDAAVRELDYPVSYIWYAYALFVEPNTFSKLAIERAAVRDYHTLRTEISKLCFGSADHQISLDDLNWGEHELPELNTRRWQMSIFWGLLTLASLRIMQMGFDGLTAVVIAGACALMAVINIVLAIFWKYEEFGLLRISKDLGRGVSRIFDSN